MMNEFLPKDVTDPKDPKKPSMNRIAIWVIVGGVGVYLLASGIWGILT